MDRNPLTADELLARIKFMIERRGWRLPGVRGVRMENRTGLIEAIGEVCDRHLEGKEAIRRISQVVDPKGRGTSLEIVEWEEKPGRKHADIIALIERAISAH